MPTATLQMISPFQKLFNKPPNYMNLKNFGCLCFPWLKPYAHHKLESYSKSCIFLGYLQIQSGYLCFDPILAKFYKSRHVIFVEKEFSYNTHSTCHVDNQCLSQPLINLCPPHHFIPFQSQSPLYAQCTYPLIQPHPNPSIQTTPNASQTSQPNLFPHPHCRYLLIQPLHHYLHQYNLISPRQMLILCKSIILFSTSHTCL